MNIIPKQVIEVDANLVDLGNDAIKLSTISLGVFFLKMFLLDGQDPLNEALQAAALTVGGLAIYHLLIKKAVNFVPKLDQEQFYNASQRM